MNTSASLKSGIWSWETIVSPHIEVVDAPSLEVLKARLDGALSNLVYWKVSLPMAGGLELDDL